ncbi:DUF5134 domain-containing protein [Kitasatospora xanthocidica]|uniref:DUF5134 domain-containing protein n=1 Tax=Kitasatospora xanthocidica TaxID=83382 RepID=UPI00167874BF|nr:DUF5134 domain-containing protein [Kitasatospora xanthocidica]GHF31975.1 DUF5134 domain-containing protein [Kitasatospora xanthocidica]
MHGPILVTWLLALLTAAAGASCLARLRRSPAPCASGAHRPLARESDAAEALMGLGMAAMAVTGATVPAAVWAALFGLPAAAFLLAAAHAPAGRAHRLHHAVGALAMTYMALAMAAPPGHQHHHAAGLGDPLLTGPLLLYFGGYTVWAGSRLLRTPGGTLAVGTAGLPQACRLTMGIGMFAMLLTM